jgi:hypothetical protein
MKNAIITKTLREKILSKQPTGFVKFGDGEFFCMAKTYPGGHNIDKDNFTDDKGEKLIHAFNSFLGMNSDSVYLGKWHEDTWDWDQFRRQIDHVVPWANYHTLLLDGEDMQNKIDLYQAIKLSPLKKIYIGNSRLQRVNVILNVDVFVAVSERNWFDNEYKNVLETVLDHIESATNTPVIVMTSAGMAAKILLADVRSRFPDTIILDFGSAFDFICTGRQSRTWEPPYSYLITLLSPFIDDPQKW